MATTRARSRASEFQRTGREVAPGVYRFGADRVNWYVVAEDGRLTVVDAGVPAHWDLLVEGLAELGYDLDDVAALVLTHGHVDHVGFAERLRSRGVPVYAHEADRHLSEAGGGPVPRELLRTLWRPRAFTYLLGMVRAGAGSTEPVTLSDARRGVRHSGVANITSGAPDGRATAAARCVGPTHGTGPGLRSVH